jgi:hypothetical protein
MLAHAADVPIRTGYMHRVATAFLCCPTSLFSTPPPAAALQRGLLVLWDTLFPALTHIVRYSITDPQKINGMQWALRSSRGESNRYRAVAQEM